MTRMDPRMAARRKVVQESHARRSLHRLFLLLGVLSTVALVAWAFRSPLLSVERIDIAGANRADVLRLIAEAGVAPGVPLMDVDGEVAADRLESDPWVSQASVTRDWPTGIEVTVEERVPVGWVHASEGWVWVASDGVVVGASEQPVPGVPALLAPDRAAADLEHDAAIVGLLGFMEALRPDLAETAVIRSVPGGFDGVIGGYPVRIGTGDDGADKALAVAAIIDQQPEPGSVITVMAPGQPAVLPPSAEAEIDESQAEVDDGESGEE